MLVATSLVNHDDVMFTPGAMMSTPAPKFENDAKPSVMLEAATQIASATSAGDWLETSVAELPAETQYVTPSAIELRTAASSVAERPPPSDMFATAGFVVWLPVTQSIPEITPAVVPEPPASSTRTAIRRAFFATPYVEPPTVPETCVPWPF